MKVVDPANLQLFTDDHPTGALGQKYLLQGQDGSADNFMFCVAENIGHFTMVRHRHNFDQFRFVVSGQMNLGREGVLKQGQLCYFPEGASYGPQDDEAGPIVLTLQFGGASGYGYMSPEQYRQGREELSEVGHFDGAVFVRETEDGKTKKKFSINAIWEQSLGKRLLLPEPRYTRPILMNPRAYRWLPVERGVYHKPLGTFSERQVAAEQWRVDAGTTAHFAAEDVTRLWYVLAGSGTAGSEPVAANFAVQVDPGEQCALTAGEELTILGFRLPPVSADWPDAEVPAFEPLPDEAVRA